MKTRLVLLPMNLDPAPYVSDDTVILRLKPEVLSDKFFLQRDAEVQYYVFEVAGFEWRWMPDVKKSALPFPANDNPPVILNDPILASRIANKIEAFNPWQRKTICAIDHHQEKFQKHYMDGIMRTFSGEAFKHYNMQHGTDFAQVDVRFYGFNRFGLRDDIDTVVHIAASDPIMNKFAELLNANKQIYYTKGDNFVSSGTGNLYAKVQSFEFFAPDGCKLMPDILELFEKAANFALDDDIYIQASSTKDVPKIQYQPQTSAPNLGAPSF